MPSAADVIRLLDLKPHPEGGHFRETFRDTRTVDGARAALTAIYYLLARGERSHWHKVDAVEAWHCHAGAALRLGDRGRHERRRRALYAGARPRRGRKPAGHRAGAHLAGRTEARRMDADRLHGGRRASTSRASSLRRRAGRRP